MSSKEERQSEYLLILAETGSPVQARRRVGVGSKTVGEWRRDPDFVEKIEEAIDVAQDAIRSKVRELALAGDTAMLSLSMKVIEPALRPQSTVNVGVKVDAKSQPMDAATLAARLNEAFDNARVRGLPVPGETVDVEAVEQVDPDDLL